MSKDLKVGIIGAAGRGGSFIAPFIHNPRAVVTALCDLNEERIVSLAAQFGIEGTYTDYDRMLDKAGLDAVVVATPMHLHVPQSIAALERNIHVLSEVPAAVTIDECRELVAAVRQSRATYMMAENMCYLRSNVLVREIARAGLFGEPYFGEGEYIHELKSLNEATTWRRKWQTGVNGNTYPTHSFGPVYEWFGKRRAVELCCYGTGHHNHDPQGDRYENEDSTFTACRLDGGGLINLRLDMLSNRPPNCGYYSFQGTRGCYEAPRGFGDGHKICILDRHEPETWHDLEELADEFLPECWLHPPVEALEAGHGGGDYWEVMDFVDAVTSGREPPIGIHEALDITLPGLVSQQSIAQGSVWLEVPDSREWQRI